MKSVSLMTIEPTNGPPESKESLYYFDRTDMVSMQVVGNTGLTKQEEDSVILNI